MEKIFEQIDNLFVNGVINGIISIVILKNKAYTLTLHMPYYALIMVLL